MAGCPVVGVNRSNTNNDKKITDLLLRFKSMFDLSISSSRLDGGAKGS